MDHQSAKPHTIYRSSEMSLYEIVFRYETAYECINMLGNQGLVQFEDMNEGHTAFQRRYVSQIRRCDEIERQLRYVEAEMKKANIKAKDVPDMPETPRQKEIGVIELILQKTTSDLKEENDSIDTMKNTLNETKEMKYVLQQVQNFFDDGDPEVEYKDFISDLEKRPDFLEERGFVLPSETENEKVKRHTVTFREGDADLGIMKVDFLTGVINRAKIPGFERMLWRVSRGNIFVRFYDIEEKLIDIFSGDQVSKSVFIVFFLGEKLKPRVTKICEGFRGHIYPCPQSFDERRLLTLHAYIDIKDLETTIANATKERDRILVNAAERDLEWAIMVRKMKSIYHTMNQLSYESTKTSLVGQCWIPTSEVAVVQEALLEGVQRSGSSVAVLMNQLQTTADPPTYFKNNKFTRGFQVLVDAYGVASYRELNPAPYYWITFPFLFGVMFGDMGHGTIILIFGLFMILKEKTFMKTRAGNEIWKIFFGGRYIIFMMGLFAIYCGFIYNDVFSKSFNIFGSKWSAGSATDVIRKTPPPRVLAATEFVALSPFKDGNAYAKEPYAYGLDPIWSISPLKIPFLNSFKMKTSIILGFVQMSGGLLLSLRNFIYFKKQINIWCEFVPQILFLNCMFGYMVFMIFYKWIVYGPFDDFPHDQSNLCAPLILIRFIDMLMMQTSKAMPGCPSEMFPLQDILQRVLLAVIVICIPWMLLTRPLIIMFRKRKENPPHQSMHREEIVCENESAEECISDQPTSFENNDVEQISNSIDEGGSNKLTDKEQDQKVGFASEESVLIVPYEEENGDEEMGEMFIHQGIHTIEFVLGSISHTASYLRLWALSLAHQQLSDVLYKMILETPFSMDALHDGILGMVGGNYWVALILFGLITFCLFAIWSTLTLAILVVMEGLSAFLHTLRLHWVEFQSKFYMGIGYKFSPFSFYVIVDVLTTERQTN